MAERLRRIAESVKTRASQDILKVAEEFEARAAELEHRAKRPPRD